jgi:N-acetylglucosaminyl-diphospho-decaprenol L-rhamnosyltransferase
MTLSVVIVNWNTGDWLFRCVKSVVSDLDGSGVGDYEIIVVDNQSTDGSVQPVNHSFPEVRVVRNTENLGFARATNQGIRQSSGRLVLLLNPDTEVGSGAVDILSRFLEDTPEVGAVGPRLLNPDGTLQISAYPEPTLFREVWRLFHLDSLWPMGSYSMAEWNTENPREVDVLTGACILLRRDVLDQCGLLDEAYFIYSEDQDLCRRLRSRGRRLFWVPRATVVHCGGQSSSQVKTEMFLRLYREKVAYFRKHRGSLSAAAYKTVLLFASLARQGLAPLSLFGAAERRMRTREVTRHYRRLVRELPGY